MLIVTRRKGIWKVGWGQNRRLADSTPRLIQRGPMHGEVSKTRWTRIIYAVFRPLWPLVRVIAPGANITTEELGFG